MLQQYKDIIWLHRVQALFFLKRFFLDTDSVFSLLNSNNHYLEHTCDS